VSSRAQEAEARRLAVAAMLAALDGRGTDIPALLADADHDTLVTAAGGLAILAATIAHTASAEWQATLREQLADVAMTMAGW
jgi:hypothetical protein